MKTLTLGYDEADKFVSENSIRGYFWDGWNIFRWVPNNDGYSKNNGMFRNGRWGLTYKFNLQDDGTWIVKVPNV
jgi:hypothetical protein